MHCPLNDAELLVSRGSVSFRLHFVFTAFDDVSASGTESDRWQLEEVLFQCFFEN